MAIDNKLLSESFLNYFHSEDRKNVIKRAHAAKKEIPHNLYDNKFVPTIKYIIKRLKQRDRIYVLNNAFSPFFSKTKFRRTGYDINDYAKNLSDYLREYIEIVNENREKGLKEAKIDRSAVLFRTQRAKDVSNNRR